MAQPGYPPNPSGQPAYGWTVPGDNQGQGIPPSYAQSPPFATQPPPTFQPQAASNFNRMYGSAGYEASPTGMEADSAGSFSEKSIRMAFVRKVYAILMVQLSITVSFIAVFLYVPEVKRFSAENSWVLWVAMAMTFVLLIVLACCSDFRRRWPLNIILLMLFTLCEGFLLGAISSAYRTDDVLMAAGICAVVCLGLTIFAFQTKWDFTACGGILFVGILILLIFGILAIFIQNRILDLVYASLGALVFSCYIVFDTQMMLGGKHKYSISPEEYIFAALNLYLDIVNLFLYILAIVGGSRR